MTSVRPGLPASKPRATPTEKVIGNLSAAVKLKSTCPPTVSTVRLGPLGGLAASTPVVIFAHIPLWAAYPEWGWATKDSAQALDLLKRFGSVTVLNGHIHQVMQKVEGNVTFHSAMSTAFPQPAPGSAASAGPMKVPAEQLRQVLGIRNVDFVAGAHSLAVVESPLG